MNEVEIVQHAQLDGLSLFLDTVDYRTPHIHPEWELLLTLKGELALTCGSQQYRAAPGTLILYNPGQPHEMNAPQGGCTFLCAQITPGCFGDFIDKPEQLSVDTPFPADSMSAEALRGVRRRLLDAMRQYLERPPLYELYCKANLGLVLHSLLTEMPTHRLTAPEAAERRKRSARLKRLLAFVDENYTEKIRLADFAAQEGCSTGYLSHFVRQTLNQSFQDYVSTVRFNCACKMIRTGGGRLLDICEASGFSDYRYFSATFRRNTGLTPEQYRQAGESAADAWNVHHSVHSLERFYSREQSLRLLDELEKELL